MNKGQKVAAVTAAVAALATPLYLASEGMILKSYRDPIVDIWTACAGHTGPDVRPDQTYTEARCLEILAHDFAEHNADIVRCVPRPMPPHVHAAMLDFALNVGAAKFCGSTMARKLNAGDWPGACAELSRWVMAGGKDCRVPANDCGGIVTRRARERALCEGS